MRKDVTNQIKLLREDVELLNKSKLARRFNCNRRTVDRYLKEAYGSSRKSRKVKSTLNDYKKIIIDKANIYDSNSMAMFKFIQKEDIQEDALLSCIYFS